MSSRLLYFLCPHITLQLSSLFFALRSVNMDSPDKMLLSQVDRYVRVVGRCCEGACVGLRTKHSQEADCWWKFLFKMIFPFLFVFRVRLIFLSSYSYDRRFSNAAKTFTIHPGLDSRKWVDLCEYTLQLVSVSSSWLIGQFCERVILYRIWRKASTRSHGSLTLGTLPSFNMYIWRSKLPWKQVNADLRVVWL